MLTLITVSLSQQSSVVAQGDALQELSGAWRVVVAEFEGREDHQLVGSRWVFQGDQLRLQNPNKENGQFKVTLDPQSTPKALRLEPRGSNSVGQQAGWLIYTRQTDRLRLAFFDNLKASALGRTWRCSPWFPTDPTLRPPPPQDSAKSCGLQTPAPCWVG